LFAGGTRRVLGPVRTYISGIEWGYRDREE